MSAELIDWLIVQGRKWVMEQRERHRPTAAPLQGLAREHLSRFFAPATLDLLRVGRVGIIENPAFYSQLGAMPLDFREMAGITFVDTVVVATDRQVLTEQNLLSLLGHELVHVVQYSLLGVDSFIERYVQGWVANGFVYPDIPFEQDAYGIQARIDSQPNIPFSVEEVVRGQLGSS